MSTYQSFIGLEIHIHLLTASKVFCDCASRFGDEPNTNVCPVCMGYPGVLPALNEEAMFMSYLVGKALNCQPAETAIFDRKNYFYPDMTKNYQISQFHSPVGTGGWFDIDVEGELRRIRIHDIHLEEDAGKMIHSASGSLLDYNRAGTALLEIVTEPDLTTGEDAEAFLQQFRSLVRYLGVCDGNMEEGSLRCDGNISVNLTGKGLGTKTEIKNVNSSKFLRLALNHEIRRQKKLLERGEKVVQETRLWDEAAARTESMRSKESAHDYRYFPEPDLPSFRPDEAFLSRVDGAMTELPLARRTRFIEELGLKSVQAELLTEEKSTADYFEAVVALGSEPRNAAAWITGDVQKYLKRREEEIAASSLSPERLAALIRLVDENRINRNGAREVLEAVLEEDRDPESIVAERGLEQEDNSEELAALVDRIAAENPQAVEQLKNGDMKPIGFFVGQIMRASGGKADPQAVQALIRSRFGL
ncbi:Asp-tRNA(Asn)/Glu-tRNA(Gln) amidotransferase subunit GatB [Marispirochaeta aestuarii]|uniref:Asp-tRNA(Asn)/Glu-tRNA(Gln) amidotransferase subunit GatB n=1 Tax=Marispirochaeta aestuarii TaxID=1963862 RepID=UPI0029C77AB6|nr:Asp-tRNA(Asn)/Glu-tRNA(Gln) amidotransferase subunit GatB [Marispirochaeta aestuarii]